MFIVNTVINLQKLAFRVKKNNKFIKTCFSFVNKYKQGADVFRGIFNDKNKYYNEEKCRQTIVCFFKVNFKQNNLFLKYCDVD